MNTKLNISTAEIDNRLKKLRQLMVEKNLDGMCIFGASRIFYLCGFHHVSTERPVVLTVPLEGEISLLIPFLEEENIPERTPHIKKLQVYPEYPGLKHPMYYLGELLEKEGLINKRLGVDSSGWGGGWGYRGPSLYEIAPDCNCVNVADRIDEMRMIKSREEIQLLSSSSYLANLAHDILVDKIKIGRTEIEISLEASMEASKAMAAFMGPFWEGSGAHVEFISGPKTSHNHRAPGSRRVKPGDVLLTETGPAVGGYRIELERMMIVGEPTEKHVKYFELVLEAQDLALEAIKPGVSCSEIENVVLGFMREHKIDHMVRTHIGHSIGIECHEAPFLDIGDKTVIKENMVFCVEPCIFIPGYAGFRHSDTIYVTKNGAEILSKYPRDIESMTIYHA